MRSTAVAPALPPPDRCAVVCGVGLAIRGGRRRTSIDDCSSRTEGHQPAGDSDVMPKRLAASLLSLRFGFTGPCLTVSTACASGATAIAEGVELLRRGRGRSRLAGGCRFAHHVQRARRIPSAGRDEPATSAAPIWHRAPSTRQRDGFVMGEGAGFMVLQRAGDAAPLRTGVLGIACSATRRPPTRSTWSRRTYGRSRARSPACALRSTMPEWRFAT